MIVDAAECVENHPNDCFRGEAVAIVVILYRTTPREAIVRAKEILGAGGLLVLVDNTDGGNEQVDAMPGVVYEPLGHNRGIAEALNVGVQIALSCGRELIFTFDQDSNYGIETIRGLASSYLSLRKSSSQPLALGPFPIHCESGRSYLRRRDRVRCWLSGQDDGILEVTELITSGLLADASTYHAIGGYDSSLFIDFVDHDWSWRLTAAGGRCCVDLGVKMPHMIGYGEVPMTMGMKLSSPLRLYYLFRNAMFLCRTRRMPFYDSVKFALLLPSKFFVFLFLHDRRERWRYGLRGLREGIFGASRTDEVATIYRFK